MTAKESKAMIVPIERVERAILIIRGQKVMLGADLAELYGVTAKRLNEQVRRNLDRFPADFMFRLTKAETAEVAANCVHLRQLKYSPTLPYAFTEHGAVMLAKCAEQRHSRSGKHPGRPSLCPPASPLGRPRGTPP